MDLKEMGNQIASIHNMMNDLEIRGGKNAKIVVYVQENCKKMLNMIEGELQKQHMPEIVPFTPESEETNNHDDHGSTD